MQTSKRLKGVGEYYFSHKLREIDIINKSGKPVISLGIGSPDLPPHPEVIKTLQQEAEKPNVHGYQSYKGSPILRNAMSAWYKKWYGVDLDPDSEILPLIGSKEGIMHLCMTYLNQGDKVLVPDPGYPTYRSAVQLAGGISVNYRLREKNNFFPDFEKLSGKKMRGIKLMFVNYPQMPTGQLPDIKLFEKLVAFGIKHKILIIHDNPYSFILNDNPMSLLSIPNAKECVVELNSLSKSHSMAGWRVGMLCGAKERIEEVLRFKSNMDSGMFLPVQLAAAKALTLGKEWHDSLNEIYKARRKKVFGLLDIIGCKYSDQQAGLFVWARIPDHYKNGYELSDAILEKCRVFIVPGAVFGDGGNKYVRVSLCCPEERIAEAIDRVKAMA